MATVRRMLGVAEDQKTLTMKRYRHMENRLVDVRGSDRAQITSKDEQLHRFLSGKPGNGNTPTATSAGIPRRSMRGRSSDYR